MRTAEVLREARRRHGDSQERAAVACGTNRTTWAAWEAGEPPTKFAWLPFLADYTGLSEDELAVMIASDHRAANLPDEPSLIRDSEQGDAIVRFLPPLQRRAA